jgi:hypothetical protein
VENAKQAVAALKSKVTSAYNSIENKSILLPRKKE